MLRRPYQIVWITARSCACYMDRYENVTCHFFDLFKVTICELVVQRLPHPLLPLVRGSSRLQSTALDAPLVVDFAIELVVAAQILLSASARCKAVLPSASNKRASAPCSSERRTIAPHHSKINWYTLKTVILPLLNGVLCRCEAKHTEKWLCLVHTAMI